MIKGRLQCSLPFVEIFYEKNFLRDYDIVDTDS